MIEHFTRINYAIGALSAKKLLAIGVPLGSLLGAGLGEMWTGSWGSAGLAGVVGASLTTAFLGLPKVMEQRRKNRESKAALAANELTRTIAFYERELKRAQQGMSFYRSVAVERDLQATMERTSKHKFQSQLSGAEGIISVLCMQLASADINPHEEYHRQTYDQLAGEEDKEIKASKKRIRDSASFDLLSSEE